MPRATRTQKATDKPDQPAEAPPAKRTRRSRMQDDALEDADQLDKQLAAVRNKCRKLAVDFDWDAIDDMVLSTEFVELGKKADALTDAKIAKMSEEEKDDCGQSRTPRDSHEAWDGVLVRKAGREGEGESSSGSGSGIAVQPHRE